MPRRALTAREDAAGYTGLDAAFTGSYTLSGFGDGSRFAMPPPSVVGAGSSAVPSIDNWPASARLHGSSVERSVAKPTLLRDIEEFVETELVRSTRAVVARAPPPRRRSIALPPPPPQAVLGCTEAHSPARLQVYREAFHMFASEFRTYKPLLVAVIREYDAMLEAVEVNAGALLAMSSQVESTKHEAAALIAAAAKASETRAEGAEERIRGLVGAVHAREADLSAAHRDAADARNARDAALTKYADMKGASQGLIKVRGARGQRLRGGGGI